MCCNFLVYVAAEMKYGVVSVDADGWTAPDQAINSCNDDFYLCGFSSLC